MSCAALAVLLAWASPAKAAFPGGNGKIAFVFQPTTSTQQDIYSMNPDGSGLTNVTNSAGNDTDPNWSPDGQSIVFTSDRDGNKEIYVMAADGTNQAKLTTSSATDFTPTWSPACTVRSECLDWLLIFGRQSERVLRTYVDHYNRQRPHRALDLHAPDSIVSLVPPPWTRPRTVRRRDRLGGLLHEYERAA